MNIVTTTPQLTVEDKKKLHDWLLKALVAEEYCYDTNTVYYIMSKLVLWVDGTPKFIGTNDYWAIQTGKVYVGSTSDRDTPAKDRLLVLLALTQYVERTPQLETTISKALIQYLSGEATQLHKTALIEAPVPMEGVAFSDDKVAMLLAGEWMTAAGETVDVSGWQVYATAVPQAA